MRRRSQIGWFLRGFATCLLIATQAGCEEAVSPMLVQPTVSADRVPDTFDFFYAAEASQFVAMANERFAPGSLKQPLRDTLGTTVGPGYRMLARTDSKSSGKVFFGLKIRGGFVGVVLPRTPDDRLIVPVEWLSRAVSIGLADETAMHNWYVAMSERLATAGKATGIAVFPNGNAMGIAIDLRRHRTGDDEIVARLKFLHAGEYQVDEWGPRIDGEAVSNAKMNGHDGISIEDILRQELTPSHPKM